VKSEILPHSGGGIGHGRRDGRGIDHRAGCGGDPRWRATLTGVGVALIALVVVVAALGPAITHLSLTPLRLIVGGLLLLFGMQWIGKQFFAPVASGPAR